MDKLPCIIDLEASGLGKQSYPIEVGYILDDGKSFCSLILPADGWDRWMKTGKKRLLLVVMILF